MLEKNSSREIVEYEPDHLGINETKKRSLWTVIARVSIRFFSCCNSNLVCANTSCRRSAMSTKQVRSNLT